MAFEDFRVICNLTDFFRADDVRSKSFMYIDLRKQKVVNDLCERIQYSFNIDSTIGLSVDGHFLPHAEDIRLLRNADVVKVFSLGFPAKIQIELLVPAPNKEAKKKSKTTVACTSSPSIETEVGKVEEEGTGAHSISLPGVLEREHKNGTGESTVNGGSGGTGSFAGELKRKRKKRRKHSRPLEEEDIGVKEKADDESVITETKFDPRLIETDGKQADASNSNVDSDISCDTGKECSVNGLAAINESCAKKKRKRQRRHRPRHKTHTNEPILSAGELKSAPWSYGQPSYSYNSHENNDPITKVPGGNSSIHTRFYNDIIGTGVTKDGINQVDTQNSDVVTTDICQSFHMNGQSNRVPESVLQSNNLVTSEANIAAPLVSQDSNRPTTNKCVLHPEKQDLNDVMPFDKILSLAHLSPIVVKRDVPSKAVVLEANGVLPTALEDVLMNDVLTLKMWKMDDNYCPQISERFTAKVLQNLTTIQRLTLEVLEGKEHCHQPKGKFDLEEDLGEETAHDDSNIIQLNWQDIIEPLRQV